MRKTSRHSDSPSVMHSPTQTPSAVQLFKTTVRNKEAEYCAWTTKKQLRCSEQLGRAMMLCAWLPLWIIKLWPLTLYGSCSIRTSTEMEAAGLFTAMAVSLIHPLISWPRAWGSEETSTDGQGAVWSWFIKWKVRSSPLNSKGLFIFFGNLKYKVYCFYSTWQNTHFSFKQLPFT